MIDEKTKSITEELKIIETNEKVDELTKMLEHYEPVKNGKGTLLVTKKNLGFVMKTDDTNSVTVDKGTSLLVLHMYENSKTKEKSILFLTGEEMCMYVTNEFDEEFLVLREGTDTDNFGDE
jgi:hypothetical protein